MNFLRLITLLGCLHGVETFMSRDWTQGAPAPRWTRPPWGKEQMKIPYDVERLATKEPVLKAEEESAIVKEPERKADEDRVDRGPRWGRITCVVVLGKLVKRMRSARKSAKDGSPLWGAMRTGGGPPKYINIQKEGVAKNRADGQPEALSRWASWCRDNAIDMQNSMSERLMGGMIANPPPSFHTNLFKKWSMRRRVLGMREFLSRDEEGRENNELADIAYVTLNQGPMERNVSTVQNRLQAIWYFISFVAVVIL